MRKWQPKDSLEGKFFLAGASSVKPWPFAKGWHCHYPSPVRVVVATEWHPIDCYLSGAPTAKDLRRHREEFRLKGYWVR